jgi:hypothetical protein
MSAIVAMSNNLVSFMVREIIQNLAIFELVGRYDGVVVRYEFAIVIENISKKRFG